MADVQKTRAITAYVYRSGKAALEEYQIESEYPMSVMSLLARLHETDPTLACRTSMCFHGTCGSCLVNVDGRDVKGCTALVNPGETVSLRPHSKYKVLQDLVVDFRQPLAAEN